MAAKRITDRKVLNVSLPSRRAWLGLRESGFQPKNDSLVGEYQTGDWGRTWERVIRRYVYLDGDTIDEAVERMRTSAEGLSNVTLDIDRNEDGYPEVNLVGRRPATEEEVAEVLRYLAWDQEKRQLADEINREQLIKRAKALGIKPEDLA